MSLRQTAASAASLGGLGSMNELNTVVMSKSVCETKRYLWRMLVNTLNQMCGVKQTGNNEAASSNLAYLGMCDGEWTEVVSWCIQAYFCSTLSHIQRTMHAHQSLLLREDPPIPQQPMPAAGGTLFAEQYPTPLHSLHLTLLTVLHAQGLGPNQGRDKMETCRKHNRAVVVVVVVVVVGWITKF
jgi:hypothetical protein